MNTAIKIAGKHLNFPCFVNV